LVVDDKIEEAVPVLKALARRGIPAAFFDGKLSGLPRRRGRLVGVRLAVLDMDLGEGGDDNSKASALVRRIERILDPSNGPYAVLIWTNHPELRALFENYVFASDNTPKPIFTVMITKADCKGAGGNFILDRVASKINEEMANVGPLGLIQAWEGMCFEAATGVSNSLSQFAGDTPASLTEWRREWKSQTLKVLRALAQAEAEQELTESNCLDSIFSILSPLQADRLENKTDQFRMLVGPQGKEIMAVTASCSSDKKAELNTMLHIALRGARGIGPGGLHVYRRKTKLGWAVSFHSFVRSFIQDGSAEQMTAWTREVFRASHPVIIETSAVCDFAQGKRLVSRLLCGFLASTAVHKRVKKAEYLKKLGPIVFQSKHVLRGQYNLYVSSRHVMSLALSNVRKLRRDGRLRGHALADLQTWFSFQAGRQGLALVK
jgi:hypothetical protein